MNTLPPTRCVEKTWVNAGLSAGGIELTKGAKGGLVAINLPVVRVPAEKRAIGCAVRKTPLGRFTTDAGCVGYVWGSPSGEPDSTQCESSAEQYAGPRSNITAPKPRGSANPSIGRHGSADLHGARANFRDRQTLMPGRNRWRLERQREIPAHTFGDASNLLLDAKPEKPVRALGTTSVADGHQF